MFHPFLLQKCLFHNYMYLNKAIDQCVLNISTLKLAIINQKICMKSGTHAAVKTWTLIRSFDVSKCADLLSWIVLVELDFLAKQELTIDIAEVTFKYVYNNRELLFCRFYWICCINMLFSGYTNVSALLNQISLFK